MPQRLRSHPCGRKHSGGLADGTAGAAVAGRISQARPQFDRSRSVSLAKFPAGWLAGLRLRDELGVQISLQAFDTAFRTVTRFLDATERIFRRRYGDAIDAYHTGLHGVADGSCGLLRRGEGISRQTIRQ